MIKSRILKDADFVPSTRAGKVGGATTAYEKGPIMKDDTASYHPLNGETFPSFETAHSELEKLGASQKGSYPHLGMTVWQHPEHGGFSVEARDNGVQISHHPPKGYIHEPKELKPEYQSQIEGVLGGSEASGLSQNDQNHPLHPSNFSENFSPEKMKYEDLGNDRIRFEYQGGIKSIHDPKMDNKDHVIKAFVHQTRAYENALAAQQTGDQKYVERMKGHALASEHHFHNAIKRGFKMDDYSNDHKK